jgi:N-acetylmuramoyl-L-alanine amidase
MQPYVIKQGDYLALLAYTFDFDADTVWNDPANADLRKLRPDPNVLRPTDILYIPDQVDKKPTMHPLVTGQTNTFVSDPPTIDVCLKFADPSRASQAFTISELESLAGLTTKPDGTVTFKVPVSLQLFTIVFTNDGAVFNCKTGYLDPISGLSGVVQRLQNLGYLNPNANYDLAAIDAVRRALRAFRYVQTGERPSTGGGGTTSQPSGAPSDDGSDDTSDDAFQDGSDDAPQDSSDDASQDSSDGPDSASGDDAGLDDSGVLNDDMTKRLLDAHGS